MKILKNLFKVCVIGALLSAPVAKATTASVVLGGTSTTNVLVTGPGLLRNISISSLATTNGTLYFYDSAFSTNTYTRGGWTNYSFSVGLVTNSYTDINGRLTTNYYTSKIITTNTIAKGIVARPLVATATSVSNAVVNLDFNGTYFGTGLLLTNVNVIGGLGGVTITVDYDALK